VGLFMSTDLDNVLANPGKARGIEIRFSVVCEGLLVEKCFEVFESEGIIEDRAVVNSLSLFQGQCKGCTREGGKGKEKRSHGSKGRESGKLCVELR
jgi:hypothetical protein